MTSPSVIWPLARSEFCRLSTDWTIRKGEPVAGELRGICVHTDRRQRAAADDHLPHALDLRQLLLP